MEAMTAGDIAAAYKRGVEDCEKGTPLVRRTAEKASFEDLPFEDETLKHAYLTGWRHTLRPPGHERKAA